MGCQRMQDLENELKMAKGRLAEAERERDAARAVLKRYSEFDLEIVDDGLVQLDIGWRSMPDDNPYRMRVVRQLELVRKIRERDAR